MDIEIPIKASFDGWALEAAFGGKHIKSRASASWDGTRDQEQGDSLCQVVMEQDRRAKGPVPVEDWGLAALETQKERVAVQDAAGKRAEAVARGKAKAAVKGKDPAVDRISECLQMSFGERRLTMPGGDRTGPMGVGPMTGRAAGYCAGYPVPGYVNPVGGGGFGGRGRGRGRGRRHWFYATGVAGWQRAGWGWPAFGAGSGYGFPSTPPVPPVSMSRDQELDMLKRQAEGFADTLDEINKRIAELEAQPQQQ